MPKKHVPQKDTPELFAKVFKVINGLKDKRSYITVHRIAKEIHAKLEQMGLKPDSRKVLIQVRRALKFGVQKNLFFTRGGKYRLVIAEASAAASKASKKSLVPLDSFELLKSKRRRAKPSNTVKKHRCTREEHSSSCRKRHKKRSPQENRRYLSRKCKSRYQSNNKSGKASSNSNSQQLELSTAEETTIAENTKSESCDIPENVIPPKSSSDIQRWDNKQEAIDKSKYGKQSRKSRVQKRSTSSSSYKGGVTNSEEAHKSRKNKKRKVKNLKEIENLSSDNSVSGLNTSTAIAAAIMIMMSLWYGYR